MAMCKSFYQRLESIAEDDNDREEELGSQCPSRLRLLLSGGHVIDECVLVDGLNSLDDKSIDVTIPTEPDPERAIVWIIPIEHIAALRCRFPSEAEQRRARDKAAEAKA